MCVKRCTFENISREKMAGGLQWPKEWTYKGEVAKKELKIRFYFCLATKMMKDVTNSLYTNWQMIY